MQHGQIVMNTVRILAGVIIDTHAGSKNDPSDAVAVKIDSYGMKYARIKPGMHHCPIFCHGASRNMTFGKQTSTKPPVVGDEVLFILDSEHEGDVKQWCYAKEEAIRPSPKPAPQPKPAPVATATPAPAPVVKETPPAAQAPKVRKPSKKLAKAKLPTGVVVKSLGDLPGGTAKKPAQTEQPVIAAAAAAVVATT